MDTIKYKNYIIKITQDADIENPRSWYNHETVIVAEHNRYNLGDVPCKNRSLETVTIDLWLEHAPPEELRGKILKDSNELSDSKRLSAFRDIGRLPIQDQFELFYRDWFNLITNFSLPIKLTWLPLYLYDHGGITISTRPFSCIWDSGQVGYIYMVDNGQPTDKQFKLLISEVREYDDYLTGNCWSYTITDKNGDSVDSCGGFLGDYDYCVAEARRMIDAMV